MDFPFEEDVLCIIYQLNVCMFGLNVSLTKI